jgi:hypothetical protein
VNEVEQSGHELEEMDSRLNHSVGQDVLQATLHTVASGALSPSEALLLISRWLNSGQVQAVGTELTKQVQFA